jgi:hypothetical protein
LRPLLYYLLSSRSIQNRKFLDSARLGGEEENFGRDRRFESGQVVQNRDGVAIVVGVVGVAIVVVVVVVVVVAVETF